MAEIQPRILVVAGDDTFESTELLFPILINIVRGPTALIKKISSSTDSPVTDSQRYFILCYESIGNEEDEVYRQIEESPKVIAVFHTWNEPTTSTTKLTKVYHIQRELITLAVTHSVIELFKNEAERHKTLHQVSLSKIYLRKAEKVKEWLMSTIRAEPSDILVIPLNTGLANVTDTIQQLARCCESVGYPSAVIRSLNEYLPTGELYDKLPYGKIVFERESPLTISRWLRELSPVRMYLYGNEQVISSEWSEQLIASEIDHVSKNIVNDDDWYIFLENEPIEDEIKWNFHTRHGRKWKITRYTPIKLPHLCEYLRFRPALRRARMTFHARKSMITAQIYEWFDQCLHYGHIQSEFQLHKYDSLKPLPTFKDGEKSSILALELPSAYGNTNSSDYLPVQFMHDLPRSNELAQKRSRRQEREKLLPISFVPVAEDRFLRCRAFMDILLKLPRTADAKQEMLDELHRIADENELSPEKIDQFEQSYHSNDAIQWYTRESFVYRLTNQALRSDDIRLIRKYRFFIVDLYEALAGLHRQISHSNEYLEQTMIKCYRGSTLSSSELDQYKQTIGSCVLSNGFLSTSLALDVAYSFSGTTLQESETSLRPVLFSIEIDTSIINTWPFAPINSLSNYEHEEEILFVVGAVFRIVKVETTFLTKDIAVIHLKMIDKSELPKIPVNISNLLPEEQTLDPAYALLGLTSLFQGGEQGERVKAILETLDVQFFDSVEDLEHLTKSMNTVQSFVVFVHTQSPMPAHYQQTRLISFAENDTHFNDLIYQLLQEMKRNPRLEERVQNAYANLADIYCPSDKDTFYVQLLLSPESRKDAEEQLSTRFPSASVVVFYQTDSCIHFLQSIVEPANIGNAILILQSDAADLDNIIDGLQSIDSIRKIYLCSKDASLVKPRRILHGIFATEHDLYTQLYSDHVLQSFVQTNRQIDVFKNKREAARCLELTEQFQRLFREHVDQERTRPKS